MILKFNPSLFTSQDEQTQKGVLDLLNLFVEERFIIDVKGLTCIFYDENGKYIFENSTLSKYMFSNQASLLKNKIEALVKSSGHISSLIRFYLSEIKVGEQPNEIHPQQVVQIIRERSIIVIENYPNDWSFITGIIEKYQNFGKRREIYLLIKKSIDSNYLIYDHAGGSGLKSQLEGWTNGIYANFYQFKLMTIFDSDKKHPNDFKEEYKNLLNFLKNRNISNPLRADDLKYESTDLIVWHMLYKRALENYVPVPVIKKETRNLTISQENKLDELALLPSQWFGQFLKNRGNLKFRGKCSYQETTSAEKRFP
jgi:hypothetical protein